MGEVLVGKKNLCINFRASNGKLKHVFKNEILSLIEVFLDQNQSEFLILAEAVLL